MTAALFVIENKVTGEARVSAQPFADLAALGWTDASMDVVATNQATCDYCGQDGPVYVIAFPQSVDLVCRPCVGSDLGIA